MAWRCWRGSAKLDEHDPDLVPRRCGETRIETRCLISNLRPPSKLRSIRSVRSARCVRPSSSSGSRTRSSQADVPFEIFQVMGVPAVSNQWWAALIAAKRQAGAYLDLLTEAGYHDGLCRTAVWVWPRRFSAIASRRHGVACRRPALLCARLTCDCIQRVFRLWANALGAELFLLDSPGATHLPPRWWDDARRNWREAGRTTPRRAHDRAASIFDCSLGKDQRPHVRHRHAG